MVCVVWFLDFLYSFLTLWIEVRTSSPTQHVATECEETEHEATKDEAGQDAATEDNGIESKRTVENLHQLSMDIK